VTRRTALLLPVTLFADERSEVLDLVTPLATALSEGNADAFLRRIPNDSPGRGQLATYIEGLIAQAEMTSSVRLLNVESDRAELDWYMEIRSRFTQAVMERRKRTLTVRMRNGALFSIEPIEFFKPADVR
jgi:hypothetical protein